MEENAKFLTAKEIAQANMAKWLLHALGYSSVVDLKTIIKNNVIWDNPVTKSDIKTDGTSLWARYSYHKR